MHFIRRILRMCNSLISNKLKKGSTFFLWVFLSFGTMLWLHAQPVADTILDKKTGNKILGFPVVAKTIETGWSAGLAASFTFHLSKKHHAQRTSNVQLLGLYSFKKQLVVALNGSQYFKNEKYVLNQQISYSSFPDKFWGIGNSTSATYENYSFNQYYISLHLLRKIGSHWFIGIPFEMQNLLQVQYLRNGLFDQQAVPGKNGYKVLGLGVSLTFDNRNHAFAPSAGTYAQLYFNHFDDYLGSSFVYSNLVLDARHFISLGGQQVLALQAYSFNNFGTAIPLRSLASLGGSTSMRGYYSGRYRDQNQLVFQAEYRRPLYKSVGMVLFANVGDVAADTKKYQLSQFKHSIGAGLRLPLNKAEKLNVRIDYGIGSKGNSGLYFQLAEAF